MSTAFVRWCFIVLGSVLLACGPEPVPALPALQNLQAHEGEILTIERRDSLADVRLRFEATGELTVLEVSPSQLRLRIPHGRSECTLTAVLGTSRASFPISIRRFAWQALPEWDRTSGPIGREYFSLWKSWDSSGLWLFGGFVYEPMQFTPNHELWHFTFADNRWTRQGELTIAPGGARVASSATTTMIFGGANIAADRSLETPRNAQFIREEGAQIHLEAAPTPPLGSYTGGFIHDTKRDRFVSFCGADSSAGFNCRVQSFSSGVWSPVQTRGTAPTPRNGFHFAFDAVSDRVIVYGGDRGGQGWADGILGDVYTLTFDSNDSAGLSAEWQELLAAGAEQPLRRNGAWVYDPTNNRLFVWGGTPDGRTSNEGLDVLTLDAGREAWWHLETSAPSRTSAQGVLDAARGRVLWGFGNGAAVYADLWEMRL